MADHSAAKRKSGKSFGARSDRLDDDGFAVVAVCIFLAIIVWLVFGQTLRHEFLNYDDDAYVYQNPYVLAGFTRRGFIWAFTFAEIGHWHPMTWFSHMLDCRLWGLRAGGHHLTNVVLHASAAILLFLAWKQMTGICGGLIGDISRKLAENAEWQMELLDESRKPVVRIRLIAETLQDSD